MKYNFQHSRPAPETRTRKPALRYQKPETRNQYLSSGIYICQIMVRNDTNIPVFSEIKKIVYIK